MFNYVKNFNSEYYTEHILPAIRSKEVDVKFDLKDNFSANDIREKALKKKYQVNDDEEKLDYNHVLSDLKRCMFVVDQGSGIYYFKKYNG